MADELSFRCRECGKEFASGAHLGNHLRKPHPPRILLRTIRAIQNAGQTCPEAMGQAQEKPEEQSSELNYSETRGQPVRTTQRSVITRTSIDEIRLVDDGEDNIMSHIYPVVRGNESELNQQTFPLSTSDAPNCDSTVPHICYSNSQLGGFAFNTSDGDSSGFSPGSDRHSEEGTELTHILEKGGSQELLHSSSGPPPLISFLIGQASADGSAEMLGIDRLENDLYDKSIPRDVHDFYNYFGDKSEVMYKDVESPPVSLESLPEPCRLLVNYCMRRRMSQSEMKEQYELQSSLEEFYKLPASHPSTIHRHFPDADAFVSFVVAERKRIVRSQGWKKATIFNNLGIKQVGVFLPITTVIHPVVSEAGGPESIREFRVAYNDAGERTFSCPLDSDVLKIVSEMDKSQRTPHQNRKRVFFSMYCDETLLSKSGSQDAAIVRIRVENVEGANLTWHDVGIPPKLLTGTSSVSKARRRQAKLELFHIFMFLILKDIAAVNIGKVSAELGFEPELFGFVCDQPQERVFLCLKRGNCQHDCSFCCFRSAEDRSARKRKRHDSERGDILVSNEQGPIKTRLEDEKIESEWHLDGESSDEEHTENHEGIPIPGLIDGYIPRDVYNTVKLQLQVAVRTRLKSVRGYSFQIEGLNSVDDLDRLANKRELLAIEGALPLPPAFGCLRGICSAPNRLYTLPTIDLLHCFDLGPSKQFLRRGLSSVSKAAVCY